jgi:hypothetical protein
MVSRDRLLSRDPQSAAVPICRGIRLQPTGCTAPMTRPRQSTGQKGTVGPRPKLTLLRTTISNLIAVRRLLLEPDDPEACDTAPAQRYRLRCKRATMSTPFAAAQRDRCRTKAATRSATPIWSELVRDDCENALARLGPKRSLTLPFRTCGLPCVGARHAGQVARAAREFGPVGPRQMQPADDGARRLLYTTGSAVPTVARHAPGII